MWLEVIRRLRSQDPHQFKGAQTQSWELRPPALETQGSLPHPLKSCETRYIQKQLPAYLAESLKSLKENVSRVEISDLPTPTEERQGFNIIPFNFQTIKSFSSEKEYKEIDDTNDGEGFYYLHGCYGSDLPLAHRLEEKGEINIRYTPGLLHEKYLVDFQVCHKLKKLDVEKKGGFPIRTLFLVL